MYGFEAINAARGWFVVVTGLVVVITGMAILATFVASVENILEFWDRRKELFKPGKKERALSNTPAGTAPRQSAGALGHPAPDTVHLSLEEAEVANDFRLIIARLGEPFSLAQLLEQAERCGVPNPYVHMDNLLKLNLVSECQDEHYGFYRWRKDVVIVVT